MTLREYRKKRDFRRTSEPKGDESTQRGKLFVVQKHAAKRLHYDFRLELDGVLKSWAVPKGPSLDPAVKTLAVHVEDHPLEYATFEGIIPEGEYGGGTVMVWDRGTWEPVGDPKNQYRAGKMKFRLQGEKLHGLWNLVRMGGKSGDDGKNWLLIKHNDEEAQKKVQLLSKQPRSVLSGRDMDQIAAEADRIWESNGGTTKRVAEVAELEGARKLNRPRTFKPQLAILAAEVPIGDEWLHELKFDGYRLLAIIGDGEVRLITRNGNDWTKRFPTIAAALRDLHLESAILDGEIVSLNEHGLPDFQQLQNIFKGGKDKDLVYYLFDAPYFEGYSLSAVSLIERKELLTQLVLPVGSGNHGVLRYSDHIRGHGEDVHAQACRSAIEGIVSKRVDSTYQSSRTASWLKIKCLKRQEFVIGGFTKPRGSRIGIGALLLGYYEDQDLRYAGRVGTGFTNETLRRIRNELKSVEAKVPSFVNPPRGGQSRGVTWTLPMLVCEVEFSEWTDDRLLRHPSFKGLRADKRPGEIVREAAVPLEKLKDRVIMPRPKSASSTSNGNATVAGVRISNPDRVVYPEQGVTKKRLAEYYQSIEEWILQHIRNRPLSLVRCPKGRSGSCFFQKHLSDSLPGELRTITIREKTKRSDYVVVDDLPGIISLVQIGVLEIHPWLTQADDIERPDRMVFDLDPGPGVPWSSVLRAARDIRGRIGQSGLQSFVLASGGKGLHVVVPIEARQAWDAVKSFAKEIAHELSHEHPHSYVATASKAKRKGKVFIDYFRNSRGATAIAPFSTRARAGGPVATPLRWDELSKLTKADQYNVLNLRRRLGSLKNDPWKDFFSLRQEITD